MKEQYSLLPDDFDVDANEGQTESKRLSLSRSSILHWLGHLVAMIVTISLIFFIYMQKDLNITREYKSTRLYPPLQNIVKYSTRTYDHVMLHSTEPPSPFKGESRPELDAAWNRITNYSMILITEEDMNRINEPTQNAYKQNGKYFAIVDGFHQLHCVDLLRKYIYRESYPDYIAFHDSESMISNHVDHCLDVLRQKVMCDTDIDLIVYNNPRSEREKPEARFSIPRLCRNFDEIRQWTLDNGWDKK